MKTRSFKEEYRKAVQRRRNQKGLTLLEAMSVLALLAFVVAGLMVYLQGAMTNSRTNELMGQVASIQSGVSSLYSGASTYTGLTTAIIADTDLLPAKMIGAASTIKHPFKDNITIAPGTGSDTYVLTASGIPTDACQKIVTMDLGKNMLRLATGTTPTGVQKRAMTVLEATANCGGPEEDIVWEFY